MNEEDKTFLIAMLITLGAGIALAAIAIVPMLIETFGM